MYCLGFHLVCFILNEILSIKSPLFYLILLLLTCSLSLLVLTWYNSDISLSVMNWIYKISFCIFFHKRIKNPFKNKKLPEASASGSSKYPYFFLFILFLFNAYFFHQSFLWIKRTKKKRLLFPLFILYHQLYIKPLNLAIILPFISVLFVCFGYILNLFYPFQSQFQLHIKD